MWVSGRVCPCGGSKTTVSDLSFLSFHGRESNAFLHNTEKREAEAFTSIETGKVTSTIDKHPTMKYGIPVGGSLRQFSNFVAYFDTRTRNAQWVMEKLTQENVKGIARAQCYVE